MKTTALTLFAGIAMAGITTACNAPSKEPVAQPATNVPATKAPPAAAPRAAQPAKTIAGVEVRELPTYRKLGRQWRGVVVPTTTGRDALIALARELHKADPESPVRFFTDDGQFPAFQAWDENYPSPGHPYPEVWVAKHYLAVMNRMMESGSLRWQLLAGDGGMHLLPGGAGSSVLATLP